MMKELKSLASHLKKSSVASSIEKIDFNKDELYVVVKPSDIVKVCLFLRDDSECMFKMLLDICGVDYPNKDPRFEVVYNLLSLTHNIRIRLKVRVADEQMVPSVHDVYATSLWFEREIWDLYGIPFTGNPDLRRILTDYGFQGHPLRKDFPLTGYVELRYDETQKRVVYEPVELQQDFRRFDFLSPWEGMTDVMLPGDEKAVKQAFGTDFYKDSLIDSQKKEKKE